MARRRRRQRFELNADVNVVSLIDVMLLLLVIFMITAPLMQGGVDIQLPQANAKPIESKDGLSIAINSRGEIFVGEQRMSMSEFRVSFKALSKNRTRNGVYLRSDKNVPYGTFAQVMSVLNVNGINNVALVWDPEEIH
jgi:biopolymer transport protein TolR